MTLFELSVKKLLLEDYDKAYVYSIRWANDIKVFLENKRCSDEDYNYFIETELYWEDLAKTIKEKQDALQLELDNYYTENTK